jgi:hypothetical protein
MVDGQPYTGQVKIIYRYYGVDFNREWGSTLTKASGSWTIKATPLLINAPLYLQILVEKGTKWGYQDFGTDLTLTDNTINPITVDLGDFILDNLHF